ncbi:MAG: pentapeptide repeat-containing protein [Leptolyngbyaceae cyanobacterium SL_5_14]|nr:pentapeptide repeat-containing protein [Leptolyngbyaceae cyanobacterium SL_5_14]
MAIAFATIGGTSFRNANLTDADFTLATLKSTDFRKANLTRTCWYRCKMLDRVRPGMTYLKNAQARQLLTTSQGECHNFDYQDLRGINLQEANVADASFIGSNLNHSNLQRANLSKAVLKQTQLEGADLTGAILTGAYIEDWGITSTTILEDVQCEYVYMRFPTKENPNSLRKPDNLRKTFAEGEFADFIQPFFDTLDLYHSQDVDPRAISIALKNLSANHPEDDLQFVAMERRGSNGLNLRFTTTPKANKSELSHEYFANYAQIKKELPVAVQIQLAERDAEIRTLKGTIEQFIQTGTHQSTIQAETIQVIQGELVVTENRGININTGDNANISGLSSGDGVVNLGTISGNVTNAINQLPEDPESDQPNLKELLTQLQQAIQTDADLSDPDKSDLLEQVQALAEVKQTEEPAKREGLARKAIKMFDATLKSLPDTAKIAEACSKLLPLILKALGFPV